MKCSVLSVILFLTLLLICLTTGCSTQWHLQRAIKKDPTILVQDTVVVLDTNNFRVKIMRSYDTLIIDGGCESDTIVRTVEVPIEKIVYHEREKWYHKLYKWSFFLLLFGLGAEGLRRIFRFS